MQVTDEVAKIFEALKCAAVEAEEAATALAHTEQAKLTDALNEMAEQKAAAEKLRGEVDAERKEKEAERKEKEAERQEKEAERKEKEEAQEKLSKQEQKTHLKREQNKKLIESVRLLQTQLSSLKVELQELKLQHIRLKKLAKLPSKQKRGKHSGPKSDRNGEDKDAQKPVHAGSRKGDKEEEDADGEENEPAESAEKEDGGLDEEDGVDDDDEAATVVNRSPVASPSPSRPAGDAERKATVPELPERRARRLLPSRGGSREGASRSGSGSRSREPLKRGVRLHSPKQGRGRERSAAHTRSQARSRSREIKREIKRRPVAKVKPVCFLFCMDKCARGDRCQLRHPSQREVKMIRAKMGKTVCRFGSGCSRPDCTFKHPEGKKSRPLPPAEADDAEEESEDDDRDHRSDS